MIFFCWFLMVSLWVWDGFVVSRCFRRCFSKSSRFPGIYLLIRILFGENIQWLDPERCETYFGFLDF